MTSLSYSILLYLNFWLLTSAECSKTLLLGFSTLCHYFSVSFILNFVPFLLSPKYISDCKLIRSSKHIIWSLRSFSRSKLMLIIRSKYLIIKNMHLFKCSFLLLNFIIKISKYFNFLFGFLKYIYWLVFYFSIFRECNQIEYF